MVEFGVESDPPEAAGGVSWDNAWSTSRCRAVKLISADRGAPLSAGGVSACPSVGRVEDPAFSARHARASSCSSCQAVAE